MMKIKAGSSVKFTSKPSKTLPPLNILIVLDPQKQNILSIEGLAPTHGANGYSDLVFHWKQEAGAIDERGNIDLKKLNKFPGTKAGALLTRIYQHTHGQPGISYLGKRLDPRPGVPLKVRWDERSITRIDSVDNKTGQPVQELYAKGGGIVQFSLTKKNNPKTLNEIAVSDTVYISGDVDYGVGDQGEIAHPELGLMSNIVVEGDVRGVFSLQSNGLIKVNKSIEGEVLANDVEAAFITTGSSVTAQNNLTAGSIINATVKAKNITVQDNTNDSSLLASERVVLEENATCQSLKVSTKKVKSLFTRYSGINNFFLGEKLFEAVEKYTEQLKEINKKICQYSVPLEEASEKMSGYLDSLIYLTKKRSVKVNLEAVFLLEEIKIAIENGMKLKTAIDQTVATSIKKLQELLANDTLEESGHCKLSLLGNAVATYNENEKEIAPYVQDLDMHTTKLKELRGQLCDDLEIQFVNVELLSDSSELRIYCGEAEQIFTQENLPGKSFTIKYCPFDEIEKLRKGTLKIS